MSVRMNTGLARLKRLIYALLALPVFLGAVLLLLMVALSAWIIDGESK